MGTISTISKVNNDYEGNPWPIWGPVSVKG